MQTCVRGKGWGVDPLHICFLHRDAKAGIESDKVTLREAQAPLQEVVPTMNEICAGNFETGEHGSGERIQEYSCRERSYTKEEKQVTMSHESLVEWSLQ